MVGNSSKIWDEVFSNVDLSYSEIPANQNQLFELLKFNFLKEIFPKAANHSVILGRSKATTPESDSGQARMTENNIIKMLEVGCGAANVSLYFAKRGHETACLDFNKNNLEIAKRNFKKEKATAAFIEGDAEKLPFQDGQFDIVCSFGLLEHFKNPQTAISEMSRVLKPNGLFFADIVPKRFSCQTLGNLFNFLVSFFYGIIKGQPQKGWEKAMRNFRPLYFENSFLWEQYKSFMEKAGLQEIKIRGNRPFPRLTLFPLFDGIYTGLLKFTLPFWNFFDRWDNPFPRFWGAGWWFWGRKI